MKKLFLFLAAVAISAVTANVFAQGSTGTTPFPGSTHTYSVTYTSGNTYDWKIFDTSMTEVTASHADIKSITTNTNGDSLIVAWDSAATVTTEYLIQVVETDASSCSNTKALPIQITASSFDLIVAGGGTNCYNNAVTVSWSGGQLATSVTYDHGDADAGITVEAQGVNATEEWTFSLGFAHTNGDVTVGSIVVKDQGTNTITPVGGVYTLTGEQTATVTFVLDNPTSYDNTSAADAQDFTTTITLGDVTCGTGSVESDDTNNSDDEVVARPNTSGISTD